LPDCRAPLFLLLSLLFLLLSYCRRRRRRRVQYQTPQYCPIRHLRTRFYCLMSAAIAVLDRFERRDLQYYRITR
jgi:hypothetical protein